MSQDNQPTGNPAVNSTNNPTDNQPSNPTGNSTDAPTGNPTTDPTNNPPAPASNPQDKQYFETQHETDIKTVLAKADKIKNILKGSKVTNLDTTIENLEKLVQVAEERPDDAQITALCGDLLPQKKAQGDALKVLETGGTAFIAAAFASADTELASDAGATDDEKQKMEQEDRDLSKLISDTDQTEVFGELTILDLSLVSAFVQEHVDNIRKTGTTNEARKARAVANIKTVAECLSQLIDLTGQYSLAGSNIDTDFGNQEAMFKAAAKDKNDPQAKAYLDALKPFAKRAAKDAITVLEIATKGFLAFMFAQAACQALQTSGASEADLNELTQELNGIMMTAMTNANSQKLGQITVLGAALLQKPLAQALAARAR
jgi:hypothetical protein